MTSPANQIKRYLGDKVLRNFKEHFSFLVKMVVDSCGEYDLQLRDGYLNVYYQGNSLAKITPRLASGRYEFSVHEKFELPGAVNGLRDSRLSADNVSFSRKKEYDVAQVRCEHVRPFFQKKVTDALASKIKAVNYKEETTFEQSLITDNLERSDFLIIDRQVSGGGIKGILDLLALRRLQSSTYRMVLLEVKLGNNPELSCKVADQLDQYMSAVTGNIEAFRECYERNYTEKRQLGLLRGDLPKQIVIDREVEGLILVGFYSGIGRRQTEKLLQKHPELKGRVQCFSNRIEWPETESE